MVIHPSYKHAAAIGKLRVKAKVTRLSSNPASWYRALVPVTSPKWLLTRGHYDGGWGKKRTGCPGMNVTSPFLSWRCFAAVVHVLKSSLSGSWCPSDAQWQSGTDHLPAGGRRIMVNCSTSNFYFEKLKMSEWYRRKHVFNCSQCSWFLTCFWFHLKSGRRTKPTVGSGSS